MASPSKTTFRWFGAEFLVVMTGVLVALGVQALYQQSEERQHERDYLVQLKAELDQTIASMPHVDSMLATSDHSGVMLVRAYRQTAPRDSIIWWLANISAGGRGRPILGTAQALVSSGDLRLIRDRSLRARIPRYIAGVEQLVETLQDLEQEFQRQRDLLGSAVDVNQAVLESGIMDTKAFTETNLGEGLLGTRYADSLYTPLPVTPDRRAPSVDVNALLASQAGYRALDRMSWAKWAHKAIRRRIREMAEDLRSQVERSIDN